MKRLNNKETLPENNIEGKSKLEIFNPEQLLASQDKLKVTYENCLEKGDVTYFFILH